MGENKLHLETDTESGYAENELDWVVVKTVFDAYQHTGRAMEACLVYDRLNRTGADRRELRNHLDQSIERHERILEELRTARQALDMDDSDF